MKAKLIQRIPSDLISLEDRACWGGWRAVYGENTHANTHVFHLVDNKEQLLGFKHKRNISSYGFLKD